MASFVLVESVTENKKTDSKRMDDRWAALVPWVKRWAAASSTWSCRRGQGQVCLYTKSYIVPTHPKIPPPSPQRPPVRPAVCGRGLRRSSPCLAASSLGSRWEWRHCCGSLSLCREPQWQINNAIITKLFFHCSFSMTQTPSCFTLWN